MKIGSYTIKACLDIEKAAAKSISNPYKTRTIIHNSITTTTTQYNKLTKNPYYKECRSRCKFKHKSRQVMGI